MCKDAVQGLGRGWAAVCGAAGLGCFAVMAQSWTNCVGVVELSAAAVQDACGGTESCGEDCIRLCVLCTQSALGRTGFRRHRRRDRLAVDVGDQDFRGHRRARAKYLKTENVWGVEESAANKGPGSFNILAYYWTLQLFVAELSVGSAPVLFIGRG